jgi:LysR family glycine cleavage system transcriptional activator
MRKLPVLRALQSFEAVSSFPSFSSAAESLGKTHGAISHQIRALETWLGKELFDRHSGGVRLTEDGDRLRQACVHAFSILEEECARISRQFAERNIAIGCSATFLSHWLLPRVEMFSRGRPQSVLSFQTRVDVASVVANKVDVLIVSASSPPPMGIEGIRLATDVIGPVCAPTWPTMPKRPEEIRGLPLMHATSRLNAWDEWASAVGVALDRSDGGRFESLSLTIEAARGGLGFAVTPEFLVRDDIDAGHLVAPLGFVKVERATCM